MKTPYDFGAIGDGLTDDTNAVQAWLDAIAGGAGHGAAGTFICSRTVLISGNTSIYGAGKGSFILKTKPGLENYHLLQNKNPVWDGTSRIDKNIAIYGTCFEGDPKAITAIHDFVDFIAVDGLTIRDCLFRHRARDLLVLSWSNNIVVDACEFFNWGDRSPFNGPPGTWVGGMAIFCVTPNYNGRITNNYIHDSGGGGGIWLPVTNTLAPASPEANFFVCTGNVIRNVAEAGIVGVPDGCDMSGNLISDVKLKDVSGHGVEIHGVNFTFTRNVILRCASSCAYFANIAHGIIASNVLSSPNQSPTVSDAAALTISGLAPESGEGDKAPYQIVVSTNQISAPDGKGVYAIMFANLTGDPHKVMRDVRVSDNNSGPDSAWSGSPTKFLPSRDDVAGAGFTVEENNF